MGRGIQFRIENKTSKPFQVGFDDVYCMIQGAHNDYFGPLMGIVEPGGSLPKGEKNKRYLEKEQTWNPFNKCMRHNGGFSMVVTDTTTGERLTKVTFGANYWRGYWMAGEVASSKAQERVYCAISDNDIGVTIMQSTRTIAEKLPYFELAFNQDGELPSSGAIDQLAAWIEKSGIADLILMAHGFNNTPAVAHDIYNTYFSKMVECKPSLSGVGVCGLTWPSQELGESATAGKLENLLAWTGTKLAFYKMYVRAMDIGRGGLANALGEIGTRRPGVRIHLAGHSMGARLVAASLAGVRPGLPIKSLFLIQGALPSNAFEQKGDLLDQAGKVDGPIVATFSSKDAELVYGWTAFNTIRMSDLRLLLVTTLQRYPWNWFSGVAMGAAGGKGFSRVEAKGGTPRPRYEFPRGGASLDCSTLIEDHNKYQKTEIAWAHLSAAGLA